MSPRVSLDSYTNEPYEPDYKSKIKDLNAPRTLFKERNVRVSGAYKAHREDDGSWRILRLAQPILELEEQPITLRGSEIEAVRTLHWLVANDRKMIHALRAFYAENPDFETFINLCLKAQEA